MNETCRTHKGNCSHASEYHLSHAHWLRNVTHTNETCFIHANESCHTWIRYVSHVMNQPCHTHKWSMSHMHAQVTNKSFYTYECVLSNKWLSNVTRMNGFFGRMAPLRHTASVREISWKFVIHQGDSLKNRRRTPAHIVTISVKSKRCTILRVCACVGVCTCACTCDRTLANTPKYIMRALHTQYIPLPPKHTHTQYTLEKCVFFSSSSSR